MVHTGAKRSQSPDLIEAICDGFGIDVDEVVEWDRLERVEVIANSFEEAIAPRRPSSLLNDRQRFRERLACFMERDDWEDCEVQEYARAVLQSVVPTIEDMQTLMDSVPLSRIRTYTDNLLLEIADNFISWRPLVRFLTDPEFRATVGKGEEEEFNRLLSGLQRSVEKRWRANLRAYDREDAVQDAIKQAIESTREPGRGYSYEGDFLGWLASSALNRLRSEYKREQRVPGIVGDVDDGTAPLDATSEYVEVFREWQERYLLVESFFRQDVQPRVKGIWESMLLSIDGDRMADQEVIALIAERTSEQVHPVTLDVTRRRLRQRLEALRFIRDKVPSGAKDLPGDASLFEYVEAQYRIAEKDIPTLRHLAGLARAAGSGTGLAWALFARLLVDLASPVDNAKQGIAPLLVGGNPRAGPGMIDRGVSWLEAGPNLRLLSELRRKSREKRIGFFLSPCWYLVVLRDMPVAEVINVLRPATGQGVLDERPLVQEIVGKLRGQR